MTTPLPLTVTHRHDPVPRHDDPLAQSALCSLCPKLCRPTCPVEHATGREAVAPWRISATVHAATAATGPATAAGWTLEAVTTAASCTGCGACGHACLVGTNLPEQSRAARAAAATAGVPLPAAVAVGRRIAEHGSPRTASTPELAAGADPTAPTALFFGCTVQRHTPSIGRAARALFAAAGEPVRCSFDEPCCGAAALDVGLLSEASALAARAAASVAGAERVVALSPGCARMMREEWPRLGVPAPRVTSAPEWLAAAFASGRLPDPQRLAGPVAWHDPCTLARGLGVVAEPRHALAALGAELREPTDSGVHTRCSGAGAAYPLVDAAGADAVTAVRRGQLAELDAPVVTACPAAARRLGAVDLLELAASLLPVTEL